MGNSGSDNSLSERIEELEGEVEYLRKELDKIKERTRKRQFIDSDEEEICKRRRIAERERDRIRRSKRSYRN